jgi:ABC-type bacteriocin/lantibiotic exporter with double-glycine peptidase domain
VASVRPNPSASRTAMNYYKQEESHTCGCACVRMMLSAFEETIPTEVELEQRLGTSTQSGTDPNRVKTFLRERGYEVRTKSGGTIEEVEALYREGWVVLLAISVDVPHFYRLRRARGCPGVVL